MVASSPPNGPIDSSSASFFTVHSANSLNDKNNAFQWSELFSRRFLWKTITIHLMVENSNKHLMIIRQRMSSNFKLHSCCPSYTFKSMELSKIFNSQWPFPQLDNKIFPAGLLFRSNIRYVSFHCILRQFYHLYKSNLERKLKVETKDDIFVLCKRRIEHIVPKERSEIMKMTVQQKISIKKFRLWLISFLSPFFSLSRTSYFFRKSSSSQTVFCLLSHLDKKQLILLFVVQLFLLLINFCFNWTPL